MDDEQTGLEKELAQHKQNLRLLLRKKAIYAAGEEPLYLLNQIEAEKQEIQSIEQRLAQLADKPLPAGEKPSPDKVRREILELLYEASKSSPPGRISFNTLVERLPEATQFHLDYLEKKGWVTLSTKPRGARIVRYYSITLGGIDSVERGLV